MYTACYTLFFNLAANCLFVLPTSSWELFFAWLPRNLLARAGTMFRSQSRIGPSRPARVVLSKTNLYFLVHIDLTITEQHCDVNHYTLLLQHPTGLQIVRLGFGGHKIS
jgi:hypothetical protein